jgi:hypothetical protein
MNSVLKHHARILLPALLALVPTLVLQLTNVQFAQAGTYTLAATNASGSLTSAPAVLTVVPWTRPLTNYSPDALATEAAAGGHLILAADGPIVLSSTITNSGDVTLDGSGHRVTLSGGGAVPLLLVSSNATLTLLNLTIADGSASNGLGGAILVAGGTLNATNCSFVSNLVANAGAGPSQGGAIFNANGQVTLEECTFTGNVAHGTGATSTATNSAGAGGAIYSDGTLTVSHCTFVGNSASGGSWSWAGPPSSPGSDGFGGAISSVGVMDVAGSTFTSNSVTGGCGSEGGSTFMPTSAGGGLPGGDGEGGALFNGGTATVAGSTFAWNLASGGAGGGGGDGLDGGDGGSGGEGGAGNGGALFGGGITAIVNCTFAWNGGVGGAGGGGGQGEQPTPDGPAPPGGNGGPGGLGVGAISGQCFVTNCTLASNSATGGAAGGGGGGGTIGSPGSAGAAGGPVSGARLVNTLLAANIPTNGLSGHIIDANYNLWADNALGIIGPLADNGGPTLTMALPVGSPAIDAGDTAAAPATDQRGARRPVGTAADIGAYEAGAPGVLTPPQDQAVALFSTAEFSVGAAGAEPLFYLWFFNAINPVASGPSPTLRLTNVQLSQAGPYTVVITNGFGAVTSSPAFLKVLATPPTLTLGPTSQTAWLGTSVSFQAAADGGPPLSFQWLFDGTNALPGATNTTLCLTDLQPAQAGAYSVVVTNTVGAVTSTVATLTLTPPVVTNSTETALRAALAAGGTVTFASSGAITLTGTVEIARDTILDGTGQDVTISGGNAVRVFYVDTNVHFSVIHITIGDGLSDFGAGIYNAGGQLTLEQCRLTNNAARGADATGTTAAGSAGGGAIYNAGTFAANLCAFSGNFAQGGPGVWGYTLFPWPVVNPSPGAPANGGALFNAAVATISGSSFDSNTVGGGVGGDGAFGGPSPSGNRNEPGSYVTDGAAGAEGNGGAIYNSGQLTLSNSDCTGNTASGGPGGAGGSNASGSGADAGVGGPSHGGALYNVGVARIANSTCAGNTAAGGAGGAGEQASGPATGGNANDGGSGYGGALCNDGAASLVNSTLTMNTSAGGAGGPGGGDPAADGGNGGNGGSAAGGGISGPCFVTNCTLVANSAIAGPGGAAGVGCPGYPGPPYGRQPNGFPGSNGSATGGGADGASMVNSLLVANSPAPSTPSGTIDSGYNLWMSTNSGAVGPLADNGGPTLTIALLPGSPAIDAADTAIAPTTDQRGFPRPFGAAADIGAYEYGAWPLLGLTQSAPGGFTLRVQAAPGQSCRLLTSTTLTDWVPVATNSIGPDGSVTFPIAPGADPQRFYRVASP